MPRRAQAGAQTSLCSPQAPGGRLCLIIPHLLPPPCGLAGGENRPPIFQDRQKRGSCPLPCGETGCPVCHGAPRAGVWNVSLSAGGS